MTNKIPEKFLNKEAKFKFVPFANPVDWFNQNFDFVELINLAEAKKGEKTRECWRVISSTTALKTIDVMDAAKKVPPYKGEFTHEFDPVTRLIKIYYDRSGDYFGKEYLTLFEFATVECFKGDFMGLYNYVYLNILRFDLPFIRVGVDYYKKNYKKNRYGGIDVELKGWNKNTLIDDYGKDVVKMIPKFDDFTIVPDNVEYKPVIGSYYNLYNEFTHVPVECDSTEKLKTIHGLMEHIFGDQTDLGYKYLKILYENPKQALPILVLVSEARQTGKTTFLNLLQIIFTNNYVLISPNDLTNDFNGTYATKNIIGIDETAIDKQSSIEKLKAIATQKSIMVNQKHVAQYSIPFFGKVVICSNREKDFMRIDEAEIRFWVRKVPVLNDINANIENEMFAEVPHLLGYLKQLPCVDYSKSRMVFTKSEIETEQLKKVVEKSKSGLYKELYIIFKNMFANYTLTPKLPDHVLATPTDIKNKFFDKNSGISVAYINEVLKDEFKFERFGKSKRYIPFAAEKATVIGEGSESVVGWPFIVPTDMFTSDLEQIIEEYELEF
jgi:hypothetical protein